MNVQILYIVTCLAVALHILLKQTKTSEPPIDSESPNKTNAHSMSQDDRTATNSPLCLNLKVRSESRAPIVGLCCAEAHSDILLSLWVEGLGFGVLLAAEVS